MADAPDTSEYLLVSPDSGDLPNSRTLTADAVASNLQFSDSGPGGSLSLAPTLTLASVVNMSSPGFMSFNGTSVVTPRTLISVDTIQITNGNGIVGNPVLDVIDDTSKQKVSVSVDGASIAGTRSNINFISGLNTTVAASDNSGSNRIDVTVNAATGLDSDTSVLLLSSANGNAANAGALTTGLLKITVAGAIATPSTAVANTDYVTPTTGLLQLRALTPGIGNIIVSNASAWTSLTAGSVGQILGITGGGTVAWVTSSASGAPANSTYLCQTSANLPNNGVNLGATNAVLGIGTPTPSASVDILSTSSNATIRAISQGTFTGSNLFTHYETYTGDPISSAYFQFENARGTIASPTACDDGDTLFALYARGRGATGFRDSSNIRFVAKGPFTDSSAPGAIQFYASNIGSTNPTLSMTINPNQTVTFEQQSVLKLGAAVLGGTTSFAADANLTIASTVFNISTTPTFFSGLTVSGGGTELQGTTFNNGWGLQTGTAQVRTGTFLTVLSGGTFTCNSGSTTSFNNTPSFGNGLSVNAGSVTLASGTITTAAVGSIINFNSTPTFNNGLTVTSNSIAIATVGTGLITSSSTSVSFSGPFTLNSGSTTTYSSGSTLALVSGSTISGTATGTSALTLAGTGTLTVGENGVNKLFNILGTGTVTIGNATDVKAINLTSGTTTTIQSGANLTLSAGSILNANGAPASGNVLTYNGTNVVWSAPAVGGTVTSVGVSSSDAFITVSGSPVTTSGTIALTINTLPATKGGTAQTTYTTGDTLYASASNTLSKLAIGTQGQLSAVSSGGIPQWTNTIDGTGALTIGANTVSKGLNILGTGTVTFGNSSDAKSVSFTSGVTTTYASGSTLTASGTINMNNVINQTLTTGNFYASTLENTSGGDVSYTMYTSAGNLGPSIKMGMSRGTVASPTPVTTSDRIGFLVARGGDGTTMQNGPNLTFSATETWSGTARGSDIKFYTVPNSTTAPILALTLTQDQLATFTGQIGATGGFSLTGGGFNISAGGGTGTFNNTGGNTFGSASPLTFNNAPSFTNGGSLAGTFSGTPIFSGNLTFSGTPTLTGGLIVTSSVPEFRSGASFTTGGTLSTTAAVAVSFAGTTALTGLLTQSLTSNSNIFTQTVTGSGSVGLRQILTSSGSGVTGISQTLVNGNPFTAITDNNLIGGGGNINLTTYTGVGFIGPAIQLSQARGSTGSLTATQGSDYLAQFIGRGFDGSAFATGGSIIVYATQAFTGAARGSAIDFLTTPNGSTLNTLGFRIGQDQKCVFPNAYTVTAGTASFSSGTTLSIASGGILDFVSGSTISGTATGTSALTLAGTGTLTVGATGVAKNISLIGTGTVTIGANGVNQDFGIRGTGTVTIGDGIDGKTLIVNNNVALQIGNGASGVLNLSNNSTVLIGSAAGGQALITNVGGGISNSFMNIGRIKIGSATSPTNALELSTDNAVKPGAGGLWTIASDMRIKRNIEDIDGELALSTIRSLRPRKYNYTPEHVEAMKVGLKEGEKGCLCPDTPEYGFVADEVETVMPECVTVSESSSGKVENLKMINMGSATALMYKSIDVLASQIESLMKRIDILEGNQPDPERVAVPSEVINPIEDVAPEVAPDVAPEETIEGK
jgi:hypothetical protein